MKKLLSLLLALVMVLSLAACGGSQDTTTAPNQSAGTTEAAKPTQPPVNTETVAPDTKYAKEITIAYHASEINLEPTNGWNATHNMVKDMIFEGLMEYHLDTGEITNCLATTCEITDDTCKRVHVILRDGVKFSNGEPLTTADVEFSLDRATYSTIASLYDSCEIVSDKEMYINLKTGHAEIIGILGCGFCGIACKSACEKDPDGLAIIGTGPYKYDMSTYVVGAKLDLVKNDLYWGEPAKADVIHFPFMPTAAARAIALENGEIDFAATLSVEECMQLEGKPGITLTRFASTNFTYMFFNNYGEIPTDEELQFRYAVLRAINKQEILDAVGDEYGQVAVGCWNRMDPAYIDSEDQFDVDLSYNPDAAREYVQNGGKNKFSCIVAASRTWCKTAAEVIQEQLRQVGITMEIEELDSTAFTNAAKPGTSTFECAIFSNLFTGIPGSGINFFMPGSVNRAQFYPQEIQDLKATLEMTTDQAARTEILVKIQKINHDLVGNVLLFWREMSFATNENLGGVVYNISPYWNLKNVYKVEK